MTAPICPYCEQPSALVKGDVIYPTKPALHGRSFYLCEPCKAWVGCHMNSIEPLGRLADAELRLAKQRAHAAFDPLWRDKAPRKCRQQRFERMRAYAWLARELCLPLHQCHIGMFDLTMCHKVIKLCRKKGSL